MKQVQKPRKPLIVYYLIAIAVLILFNSFVFPAIVGEMLRKLITARSLRW